MKRRWLHAAVVAALLLLGAGNASAEDALAYSGLFLPNGEVLVGWSDGAVTRTPAAGGLRTARRRDDGRGIVGLAASPDGAKVAAASRTGVDVFDAVSGRLLLAEPLSEAPGGLFFSPDGARLLVRGDERSMLFDVVRGRRLAVLPGGDARLPGFIGALAVTRNDGRLQVFDAGGARVADVDLGVMYSGVEAPEGRLLASTSRGLRLVDPATGHVVAEGDRQQGPRRLLRLAPNRVLGLDDGAWRLFSDAGRELQGAKPVAAGDVMSAFGLGATGVLRGRQDGAAEVLDPVAGVAREAVQASASAQLFAVSADGRRALLRTAGGVARIYDIATGRPQACLAPAAANARCRVSDALMLWEARPSAGNAAGLIAAIQAAHADRPRQLEFSDAQAYLAAARFLREMDDTASARDAYEWALDVADPDVSTAAQLSLAEVLLAVDTPSRVVALLEPVVNALRAAPDARRYDCPFCQALDLLSQAQAQRGQFEAARKASLEAMRSAPRAIDPSLAARFTAGYATALEGLGRRIEAEAVRSRLLQGDNEATQPTDVAAARQLLAIAESLAERNERPRAEALARDATAVLASALDPSHPDLLDAEGRLGALRLAARDPSGALEPLRDAARALAASGSLVSRARYNRFRPIFRLQVAAAWDAALNDAPGRPPAAPPPAAVRHRAPVTRLAASPDGRLLASGDEAGQVMVWTIADGAPAGSFRFDRAVRGLVFTSDGEAVVIGLEDTSALQVRPIAGAAPRRLQLARPLAVSGRTGAIYATDGRRQVPLEGTARRTGISANGRDAVATLDDGRTCVISLAGRPSSRCVRLEEAPPRAVALSPEGDSLLTADGFGPVRRFDAATLEASRAFGLDQPDQAESAAISDDGALAAVGSIHGEIRILDWASGQTRFTLEGHAGRVGELLFLPDGRLVSGGSDGRVVLWDLGQPAAVAAFGGASYGAGHAGAVVSVDITADGRRVISTGMDRTLRLWDVATGAQLRLVRLDAASGQARFLDPERVGVAGPTVRQLDFGAGTFSPGPHNDDWAVAAWSTAEHPILSAGTAARLDLVRTDTGAAFASIPVAAEQVVATATRIATLDRNGEVKLWDASNGRLLAHPVERGGRDIGIVGDVLFVNTPEAVKRIDARTGSVMSDAIGAGCAGRGLAGRAFSYGSASGGGLFALWGVNGLCLFDGGSGAAKQLDATQFRTAISSVALTPDGALASIGLLDGGVVIADVRTGEVLWRLEGHTGEIVSQAYSADGVRLVTGSRDGTARVWDLRRGAAVAALGE